MNCSHYSVHNDYADDSKPKRGPKFQMSTESELELVSSTNYCWERNVPRTQEMLKSEICHYLDVEGFENRFKHGIPGMQGTLYK